MAPASVEGGRRAQVAISCTPLPHSACRARRMCGHAWLVGSGRGFTSLTIRAVGERPTTSTVPNDVDRGCVRALAKNHSVAVGRCRERAGGEAESGGSMRDLNATGESPRVVAGGAGRGLAKVMVHAVA